MPTETLVSLSDSEHAERVQEIQSTRRGGDKPTCTIDGIPARVTGYWCGSAVVRTMSPEFYPGTRVVMMWLYGEGYEVDWQTARERMEGDRAFSSSGCMPVGCDIF